MATLDRIRKHSGIVIVTVFVALMLSLLGNEWLTKREENAEKNSINGHTIEEDDILKTIESYGGNSGNFQLRNAVWEQMVMDRILTQELENSSLAISNKELEFDIMNNPQIRQGFTNANGQFDQNSFFSYVAQMRSVEDLNEEDRRDPQYAELVAAYNQWTLFNKDVKVQSKNSKFNTAVEKALFMPEALAKIQAERRNTQHPAQYVYVPYIDVNESDVEASDADARAYYTDNQEDFPQEEGRNIEFIDFPFLPSQADRDDAKADLAGLALEWLNVEDDSLFIEQLSDDSYVPEYVTESELQGLDTLVFGQDIGYQMGPIDLDTAFTILKLVDKKSLPESVEARHILIPYVGAQGADVSVSRSQMDAYVLADSLFTYLDSNRTEFDNVREEFSSDTEANEKGGSLGYLTRGRDMDRKNLRDFCFLHKEGKLGVVFTEFGFHIVEITDQKGSVLAYKVGKINRNILPSKETIKAIESAAYTFKDNMDAAEDYRALAAESNYFIQPARNLGRFEEMVPGLGNNRDVVSWAYQLEREEGDISVQSNEGKGVVVVILTDVLEEGYAKYEKVADQCLRGAIKNKKKAIISNQVESALAEAATIEDVAKALGKDVRSLNFSIGNTNVPMVGNEPEVVGAICGQEPGIISPALEGNNGIFVAFTAAPQSAPLRDYSQEAQDIERILRMTVSEQAYGALKEKFEIVRYR